MERTTSQETHNLENISLSNWQKEQLARATLEACRKFYSDPENVKKYEAWKAERDETKRLYGDHVSVTVEPAFLK